MSRFTSAALALSLAALFFASASRADEAGGSGGGDVQAHPKELTAAGTKGSKLKIDPKNNPAAGQKVDPAQVKAATEAPKETKAPAAVKAEEQQK